MLAFQCLLADVLAVELGGHGQDRERHRAHPGRREDFDETYMAVGGLVSDRAAER
jgi:hypothetical protein